MPNYPSRPPPFIRNLLSRVALLTPVTPRQDYHDFRRLGPARQDSARIRPVHRAARSPRG